MVYLKEIIKSNKLKLIQNKNIELAAYLSISSIEELEIFEYELSPDEEVAFKGYKKEAVEKGKVLSIISKPAIKGIDALSNIYKFAGLYLSSKEQLKKMLKEKFSKADLKQKYFLSKIEPDLKSQLMKEINEGGIDPVLVLIKKILGLEDIAETELDNALLEISKNEFDVQTQILLEDLEKVLIKIKYINKNPEEVIRDVLANFSNAIQKILKGRRKGHVDYRIEDEYDVQDILYVVLKSIFPGLRDEDPIPKVGAKSTKIDLILREEKILIEVKMIKEKDANEIHFIEQLKVDFESYHECKWLNKLFCFVYDPHKKTKDISNFHDLNGDRTKG
ncbi:MAG TPA: hypothetical protein VIL78_03250, partial [Hanamia sp.]